MQQNRFSHALLDTALVAEPRYARHVPAEWRKLNRMFRLFMIRIRWFRYVGDTGGGFASTSLVKISLERINLLFNCVQLWVPHIYHQDDTFFIIVPHLVLEGVVKH